MPQTTSPILISITGGEAAGKKAVQAGLKSRLLSLNGELKISTLHMADYALPPLLPCTGTAAEGAKRYDLERLAGELEGIVRGDVEEAEVDVVIAEGRYMLCCSRLVEVAGVKIFVDCDSDVRLARKVIRESGTRSLDRILDEYVRKSKPAFEQAILPTKHISDIILPAGAEGPGLDLIAHGIMDDLKRKRGRQSLPGILASVSHLQLPLTLSEVDLTTGAPSYYQTV
ncbi:unnamed protein product [Tuber melanosporum]|jgi:uridine kinase|uniref:(Perigord truffle) hypothetical protein n=1 Tax=Tuber melanosporum (strain Mel28) TaxID=656061 RepID=D5GIW2_TUBMM|nr:uncharacterized protein GSTUM_00008711001 [Tuber melanosporum]CAZ84455.1 unnamed protein product [Tuber melanosporum]